MGIPSLSITARTTLGAKLVQASSYFESGTAELVGSEGAAVQRVITAISAGSLSINSLTTINKQVSSIVAALSSLEAQIMKSVAAGTHLHNSATW